jgi:hypothetical protein
LLQILVEAVIDACALLVTGLRLGLPGEEDDLFEKLARRGVISEPMVDTLKRMKGLRNLLVHEYGHINDQIVFETIHRRLGDFGRRDRRRRAASEHVDPADRPRAASGWKNTQVPENRGPVRTALGCGVPQGSPRYTVPPISWPNCS